MESSIDVFGRSDWSGGGKRGPRGYRGPVGPRGPPGIDSIEHIVRWFPKMATTETRYNEFSCLKISDPSKDLGIDVQTSAIKRWNSSTSKSNNYAESLSNNFSSKNYVSVVDKRIYALRVNGDNAYRIAEAQLILYSEKNYWVWTCITFRLLDAGDGKEQYLFSNSDDGTRDFRGVSVTERSIKIYGSSPQNPAVVHTKTSLLEKWCTVYVIWSEVGARAGNYVVLVQDGNGGVLEKMNGTFLCQQFTALWTQRFIDMFGVYNVAKSPDKILHGFCGDVAFFEFYIEKNAKEAFYPDRLRDLVIHNQSIVV